MSLLTERKLVIKQKKRLLKRMLTATILLCLSGCLALAFIHRSASALTPLFKLGYFDSYAWISYHELLIIRTDRWQFPSDPPRLSTFDTNARKEIPAGAFAQRFNRSYVPHSCRISPDGKRLLWVEDHLTNAGFECPQFFYLKGVTLDGKQVFSCPLNSATAGDHYVANSFCWQSDSKHWLEFRTEDMQGDRVKQIVVHTFGTSDRKSIPGLTQRTPLSSLETYLYAHGDLFYKDADYQRPIACIQQMSLKTTGKLLHSFAVSEAFAGDFPGPSLSPNAASLACIHVRSREETWWYKAVQYLHFPHAPPLYALTLTLCDIDGANSRIVALDGPEMESNKLQPAGDVQWSPSGNSLGFVCKEAFYMVKTR